MAGKRKYRKGGAYLRVKGGTFGGAADQLVQAVGRPKKKGQRYVKQQPGPTKDNARRKRWNPGRP